jgi:hypothetical protein
MSFSRELKDFAQGFGGGVREGYEMSEAKKAEAQSDWYEKRMTDDKNDPAGGGWDPSGGWSDESNQPEEGDPGYKPKVSHSMLYNAGQWIKKQLGGGPATTPEQAQQNQTAAALAINTGAPATPDTIEGQVSSPPTQAVDTGDGNTVEYGTNV